MPSSESVSSFKHNTLQSDLNTPCDCFLQDFFFFFPSGFLVNCIGLHLSTHLLNPGITQTSSSVLNSPVCPPYFPESILDLVPSGDTQMLSVWPLFLFSPSPCYLQNSFWNIIHSSCCLSLKLPRALLELKLFYPRPITISPQPTQHPPMAPHFFFILSMLCHFKHLSIYINHSLWRSCSFQPYRSENFDLFLTPPIQVSPPFLCRNSCFMFCVSMCLFAWLKGTAPCVFRSEVAS